tara:strand:- start:97 stop:678 length:582 start_codon:yes stop_codon:yes gene_type:complete
VDKGTKNIVMGAGIGVGAYILYRMMRTDTPSTSQRIPLEEVTGTIFNSPEQEVLDPIDYAKNQFGVGDIEAEKIISKANYIMNHPESDWYKHTQKRASEEMREFPQQAIHEAWWVINKPTRRLEYIENTWSLNQEQAKEVLEYIDNNILPSAKWVADTEERAKERGRSVENQLSHEAVWQLYTKEGAKYEGTL